MVGHYLTVALRNFRRHKVNTGIKIIALSLGLACFLSAYIVSTYFARVDTQFAKSDRIAVIDQQVIWPNAKVTFPFFVMSAGPVAKYLKADMPELGAVARRLNLRDIAVRTGDHKSYRAVQAVDPSFLKIFDLPFLAGNPSSAMSSPKSAIITATAAKAIFGTSDVMGRHLTLQNQDDITITGVISEIEPPSHLGRSVASTPFDILVSMDVADDLAAPRLEGKRLSDIEDWLSNPYTTYALLPADGSLTLDDLNKRLQGFGERHILKAVGGGRFRAIPVSDYLLSFINVAGLGGGFGLSLTTLLYLFGGLILTVACLDFVNLATAESTTRAKEVGMRKTLGASRRQVVTQSLYEAGLLVLSALVIALAVTVMVISLLNRPTDLGFRFPSLAGTDFWVFLFALLGVVILAAGGYPALVLARIRPIFALRSGAVRAGPKLLRTILVGAQFAVASFLLISVVLFSSEMSALRSAGLSRFSDPYVLVSTQLSSAKIDPKTFRNELLDDPSIKAVTGVERPLWATWSSLLDFTNSADASSKRLTTQRLAVSYDYFSTMGIKILAGRALGPGDLTDVSDEALEAGERGPSVIVDRAVAADFGWTDPRQAIGKEIFAHLGSGNGTPIVRPVTIVGVSENAPFQISRSGSSSYVYYLQPDQAALPVIRIDKTKVAHALAHIDEVWNALAPTVPLQRSFADEKFEQAAQLFTLIDRTVLGLAIFAVVIASMGLFGVATFIVDRRTREIGVRKTLGATTSQVLRLLLWDFSKPVIVANLIAWPAAYFAAEAYLSRFVTRVSLTPLPFIESLAIAVFIAWIAVGAHATRAARTKPASVLRYE